MWLVKSSEKMLLMQKIVMHEKKRDVSKNATHREAKFKTSLRVGFFLDFRNFNFASSTARIKKYSYIGD